MTLIPDARFFTQFRAVAFTALLLLAGAAAAGLHEPSAARVIWMAGVVLLGAPLVFRTVRGMLHGHFAADVVASLSIVAAIALMQPLVGLVIVLMQRGGEALEHHAEGRASTAVRSLEAAVPRVAHRMQGGSVQDVPTTAVQLDDVLLIRPGDMVPCDGIVVDGDSELDTSSLSGEAMPVATHPALRVLSGSLNGRGSFRLRVTARASESQYERIVEMVRTAQAEKAPLQRLADKYAVWFTPFTLLLCAATFAVTRDWMRVLAVLAVATPCPLILATPVAIIGGINRAAKEFIIIKNGGALERLSDVTTVVFDKTGTLTFGKPRVQAIRIAAGFDRTFVLGLAASVEEHSSHLLARVIVETVRATGAEIPASTSHVESAGEGVTGVVGAHVVHVGSRLFALAQCTDAESLPSELDSSSASLSGYVVIDGRLAAVFEFADELRPEALGVLAQLKQLGIRQISLLSGDNVRTVEVLAALTGITDSHGQLLPAQKGAYVHDLRAKGAVVMMVGDGVNDAPALSAADVGVAMAALGGGISAEAADVIILADSLTAVSHALAIGRRTKRIALQSIWAGLGLSALGMCAATLGGLAPIAGAGIQELIDVAVILNALRTTFVPKVAIAAGAH